MSSPNPSISVNVDPTNPGQFFACCGLLELADRLWPGAASGAFSQEGGTFEITRTSGSTEHDAQELLAFIRCCSIGSTMSDADTARLKQLKNLNKRLRTRETDAEAQRLDDLWQRERLCFPTPRPIWLDWWADDAAGGSRFKTWAGKQVISDIVRNLRQSLSSNVWKSVSPARWLGEPANGGCLPLYFDADIGGQSSSLDVGFSLDALDMRVQTKPLLELAAFVGLQRFRPTEDRGTETFRYVAWTEPLPPCVAAAVCCGALPHASALKYEFRLLYRTKYLKSFLPATPTPPEVPNE